LGADALGGAPTLAPGGGGALAGAGVWANAIPDATMAAAAPSRTRLMIIVSRVLLYVHVNA
jgi:hypothetical protein